nr:tetratricopeptide repeat protein [uncultured Duganella sp.]
MGALSVLLVSLSLAGAAAADTTANTAATAGDTATAGEAAPPTGDANLYREAMRALTNDQPERAAALLLRFLADQPRHAGAWLDLALSQCALGHADEAERLFREIETRFAPPPGIQELIRQNRERGCNTKPSWRALWVATLGRGYDNNVNQGASNALFSTGSGSNLIQWELADDFLPKADHHSSAGLDYMQQIDENGALLLAQAHVRRNDHVDEQDYASLLVGYERPWEWGAWRGYGTVALSALRLQNQLYQRQEQLQVRATPPLVLADKLQWTLLGSVSHIRYPTRARYDSTTFELGSNLSWRGARQVTASLSGLVDRGQNGRLGGDRQGWYGALQLNQPLGDKLRLDLGATRQVWRSDDVYAPDQIDIVRHQDTRQLRAALQWSFTARQSLQLEWRAIRNRENISLFQYNSRLVQLNWRWDNF